MKRTAEELILEAQALTTCNDADMWDAWLEGLNDSEMVIYQKWVNRGAFVLDDFKECMTKMVEMCGQAVEIFKSLADMPPMPAHILKQIELTIPYELAGCPYGKSVRGAKKWRKQQPAR